MRAMFRKCTNWLLLIRDFCAVFFLDKNKTPVRYFSAKPNVGDALNVYLISKITGRGIVEIQSGGFSHILGIGSILHFGTSRSSVWGAGAIEENQLPELGILKQMEFAAVRGHKTQALLSAKVGRDVICPVGDPAVLMPLFYSPKPVKKHAIGIVPHYVDKSTAGFSWLLSLLDAVHIDVALPVEQFVDALAQCDLVLSSSLHGLILSDSYNVPNLWVKFSDDIIGGRFKFEDYYSTTDSPVSHPVDFTSPPFSESFIFDSISKASISAYSGDKSDLFKAFPRRYMP